MEESSGFFGRSVSQSAHCNGVTHSLILGPHRSHASPPPRRPFPCSWSQNRRSSTLEMRQLTYHSCVGCTHGTMPSWAFYAIIVSANPITATAWQASPPHQPPPSIPPCLQITSIGAVILLLVLLNRRRRRKQALMQQMQMQQMQQMQMQQLPPGYAGQPPPPPGYATGPQMGPYSYQAYNPAPQYGFPGQPATYSGKPPPGSSAAGSATRPPAGQPV